MNRHVARTLNAISDRESSVLICSPGASTRDRLLFPSAALPLSISSPTAWRTLNAGSSETFGGGIAELQRAAPDAATRSGEFEPQQARVVFGTFN
jgi:hypothetical protein